MSISPNGFISTSDLKIKLVEILKPSGEDAELSLTRPNEIKFMQIVGNLKSHDTFERNGFATYEKVGKVGGFRITPDGQKYLLENNETNRYLLTNDFNWEDVKSGLILFQKSKFDKRNLLAFDENIIVNEGLKKIRETSVYTRSSKLREFAIANFTIKDRISCKCCNFNFSDFYGENLGKGFIEIHHTKPIFTYEDEDLESTFKEALKNLIPVCSNCHRMIHRNWKKPIELQVLIESINANGEFRRK